MCDPLDLHVCLVQALSKGLRAAAVGGVPHVLRCRPEPFRLDAPSRLVAVTLEYPDLTGGAEDKESALSLGLAQEAAKRNQGSAALETNRDGRVRIALRFRPAAHAPTRYLGEEPPRVA